MSIATLVLNWLHTLPTVHLPEPSPCQPLIDMAVAAVSASFDSLESAARCGSVSLNSPVWGKSGTFS